MLPVDSTHDNSNQSAATGRDGSKRNATSWRTMPSDFRRSLFPLSILTRLFGFDVFEYPSGRFWPTLTVLYSGLFWSTFMVALICARTFIFKDASLPRLSEMIFLSSVALSFLFACFMAQNAELYQKCLSEIAVLDDTLEILGRAKDYHIFRNTLIKYIFCWLLVNFFLDTWYIIHKIVHSDATYRFLLCYLLDYVVHAPSIVPMQYYLLLRFVASRFDCIYEMIEETAANAQIRIGSCWEERSQSRRRVILQEEDRQRILWTSIHAHLKLCDILRNLNKVFEVQICLEMIFILFNILCNFISLYAVIVKSNRTGLGKWHDGLMSLVWLMTLFFKVLTPNHICDVVTLKAARVKRIADRVLVLGNDPKRKDLSVFLLRAYHRPLKLSAMGFFNFGYEFVFEFFASAMTGLVIMLQLNSWIPSPN